MKWEYIPSGYSTRYEYNRAQERKRKWRDRIVNAVTLIIFFAVYIIAGVLEP